MQNLFDVKDKVIVITGGGGVLAGTLARYVVKQNAKVIALDLRQEGIDALKADCPDVDGFTANVLDQASLDEVSAKIAAKYGRVDVLLNGAGGNMPGATIAPDQTIFDLQLDAHDKVVALNLKGTVMPSITFAKIMVKQEKGGCIVNFSSMSATQALTRVIGYGNAKAAIDNFTRALATELGMKFDGKTRVNAIAPGFVIGNQNRALLLNPDGSYTHRGNQVISKTPMGRFGDASEICGCIHYLISDASSFVTGTIIPVDGGFSAFTGV